VSALQEILEDPDSKEGYLAAAAVVLDEAQTGSSSSSSGSSSLSGPIMTRSLKSYLSLPLSQYSVLDPRWISNLPEDWERQLQQQQEQEDRIAKEQQLQEDQKGKELHSSASSNGTSAAAADGAVISSSAPAGNNTLHSPSSSSSHDVAEVNDGQREPSTSSGGSDNLTSGGDVLSFPPVDAAGMSTGVFLLKVPLQEIVGLDLKPQVVIQVHADTRNGKVRYEEVGQLHAWTRGGF
jgi:hypothetical protein